MKRILILFAAILAVSAVSGQNLRFASRPSLSPDGQTLYFSYLGDIYTVPAAGGQALSLVAMQGKQSNINTINAKADALVNEFEATSESPKVSSSSLP